MAAELAELFVAAGVKVGEFVVVKPEQMQERDVEIADGMGDLDGLGADLVGATDEIGAKAVDVAHPIRDLHVTLLHLLGLDDNKLTYFHAGRYKQLSQFGGEVIKELIA